LKFLENLKNQAEIDSSEFKILLPKLLKHDIVKPNEILDNIKFYNKYFDE